MNAFHFRESESETVFQSFPASHSFYPGVKSKEEHRVAPRHKVNLPSSVLITAVGTTTADNEIYFVLRGQLRDVSISGLAIIISDGDLRELQRLGNSVKLELMLPLPVQAIELEAVPVRYQQSRDIESGQVLLGAQITNMSGRDRVIFMDFINQCDSIILTRHRFSDSSDEKVSINAQK